MTPYEHLKQTALENIPGLKIKEKKGVWFWKLLPKKFMEDISNAFASTVWIADTTDYYKWEALAHELTHVLDFRAGRIKYILERTFPQNLSLPCLVITAIFVFLQDASYWQLLGSLFFLLPWPSSTRARLEIQAYFASLFCCYLEAPNKFTKSHDNVIGNLTGWIYYNMISKKKAEELLPIENLLSAFMCMVKNNVVAFAVAGLLTHIQPSCFLHRSILDSFNDSKITDSD